MLMVLGFNFIMCVQKNNSFTVPVLVLNSRAMYSVSVKWTMEADNKIAPCNNHLVHLFDHAPMTPRRPQVGFNAVISPLLVNKCVFLIDR